MKSGKQSIKRTVKKRIELRQGIGYLQPKGKKNMGIADDRVKAKLGLIDRIPTKIAAKPVYVDQLSGNIHKKPPSQIFLEQYKRKIYVDYDAVIIISSYNRFKKLNRILKQLYEQETKYKIKVSV